MQSSANNFLLVRAFNPHKTTLVSIPKISNIHRYTKIIEKPAVAMTDLLAGWLNDWLAVSMTD